MQYVRLHDLAAFLTTLMLLGGILLLIALPREVPDFLQNAFTAALTWTLRGGVQTANDWSHQRRNDSNAGPPADPNP